MMKNNNGKKKQLKNNTEINTMNFLFLAISAISIPDYKSSLMWFPIMTAGWQKQIINWSAENTSFLLVYV